MNKYAQMADRLYDQEQQMKRLEEENAELKEENKELQQKWLDESYKKAKLVEQLNKAKELLKGIVRVTWNEGWNYSLDWKVKAEQFLNEVEK